MTLSVGSELLGYRIESVLGRGGMGVVYLAEDLRLRRPVALKLLAPELVGDARARERLIEESRLAASLDHPNIVPVYAAGEADGTVFVSMRFVDGADLRQRLRSGPLSPDEAIRVVTQLGAALDAAHGRGLVHGDVKPSNVLLVGGDGDGHVYLADFGVARRFAQRLEPGALMGTLDYVAPEQIRGGDVDGRADVYSLGCLLHECLSGAPPFVRGSDAAVLFAHLEEAPEPLPPLERVLGKALAKDPAVRHQTCAELVADARRALGIDRARRRWKVTAAAVALGAAGLVALLAALAPAGRPTGALRGRLFGVDPAANRVVRAVSVGSGPQGVAVGSGRVWVASYDGGSLWLVDPATGSASSVVGAGRPYAVVAAGGSVYVASESAREFGGSVLRFDARTGDRKGGVDGLLACSLTGGAYGLWVAGCPNVQELDVGGVNPRVARSVAIPLARRLGAANYREALVGMAEGEGAVWVLGDAADRRLWRIDPGNGRIVATIPLSFPPAAIAVGGGEVWVTDGLGDRLVRIDPATNRVDGSYPAGRGAAGVAFAGGSVWVADAIGHALTRLDPLTGRTLATIPLPAAPRALAAGDGRLWVVGDAR